MRFLLDTHAFLWWLAGDTRLGVTARQVIADDAAAALVATDMATQRDDQGSPPLSIRLAHAAPAAAADARAAPRSCDFH